MTDEEWLQVLEKKKIKFWSSSLPPYVHMVGGKRGCTFATVKCLLLVVIWQFFLCGFNFSCSWRHCIQISQIRIWSARNDATSDNWVLTSSDNSVPSSILNKVHGRVEQKNLLIFTALVDYRFSSDVTALFLAKCKFCARANI